MAIPEYKVECPAYKTSCDISTCPRYLCETNIDMDNEGRLVASGCCHQGHLRYFSLIKNDKITIDQGEEIAESKPEQDNISNQDLLTAITSGFKSTNALTTAKANEIKRIIRTDTTKVKPDKRTLTERGIINQVIWKYLKATEIDKVQASFNAICDSVFRRSKGTTNPFATSAKLRETARYDLENFYNKEAELAKIKSGQVQV